MPYILVGPADTLGSLLDDDDWPVMFGGEEDVEMNFRRPFARWDDMKAEGYTLGRVEIAPYGTRKSLSDARAEIERMKPVFDAAMKFAALVEELDAAPLEDCSPDLDSLVNEAERALARAYAAAKEE